MGAVASFFYELFTDPVKIADYALIGSGAISLSIALIKGSIIPGVGNVFTIIASSAALLLGLVGVENLLEQGFLGIVNYGLIAGGAAISIASLLGEVFNGDITDEIIAIVGGIISLIGFFGVENILEGGVSGLYDKIFKFIEANFLLTASFGIGLLLILLRTFISSDNELYRLVTYGALGSFALGAVIGTEQAIEYEEDMKKFENDVFYKYRGDPETLAEKWLPEYNQVNVLSFSSKLENCYTKWCDPTKLVTPKEGVCLGTLTEESPSTLNRLRWFFGIAPYEESKDLTDLTCADLILKARILCSYDKTKETAKMWKIPCEKYGELKIPDTAVEPPEPVY